jgi:putative transposase
VADWCRFNGTGTVFIDPGSPWQNAWIESFSGRLRDEFLNGHRFDSLLEAQCSSRTGESATT